MNDTCDLRIPVQYRTSRALTLCIERLATPTVKQPADPPPLPSGNTPGNTAARGVTHAHRVGGKAPDVELARPIGLQPHPTLHRAPEPLVCGAALGVDGFKIAEVRRMASVDTIR